MESTDLFGTAALREVFKPLVKVTEKLPAPLAYTLAALLAILVIIALGVVISGYLILLVGFIVIAGLAAFVFADWDTRRRPKPVAENTSSPIVTSKLGIPAPGKLGILIDLSHQQDKWKQGSIFDLPHGKGNLISLVIPPPETPPWDIQEIKDISHFQVGDLINWRSMIFGLPWHKLISPEVLSAITGWVNQGGRLILLGYELGERHHRTNLNMLSDRHFGIRFNSDIVAPESLTKTWESFTGKPYSEEIVFNIQPKKNTILEGVRTLCMRNICTLTVEPGSSIILWTDEKKVSREVNPNYVDGWTAAGTHNFRLVTETNRFPIIAEAAQGLCGKGKVIAIGTWDFFGGDPCFKNNDNYTFTRNLLKWSVEQS
jgi:hypothetical protein